MGPQDERPPHSHRKGIAMSQANTPPARPPVSFEFFPPNTPVGTEKLRTVVQELSAVRPHYFSVTYGDRKSTRLNSSHSQQSRMPSSA